MSQPGSNKIPPLGRGGRGIALLQALQMQKHQQTPRPGFPQQAALRVSATGVDSVQQLLVCQSPAPPQQMPAQQPASLHQQPLPPQQQLLAPQQIPLSPLHQPLTPHQQPLAPASHGKPLSTQLQPLSSPQQSAALQQQLHPPLLVHPQQQHHLQPGDQLQPPYHTAAGITPPVRPPKCHAQEVTQRPPLPQTCIEMPSKQGQPSQKNTPTFLKRMKQLSISRGSVDTASSLSGSSSGRGTAPTGTSSAISSGQSSTSTGLGHSSPSADGFSSPAPSFVSGSSIRAPFPLPDTGPNVVRSVGRGALVARFILNSQKQTEKGGALISATPSVAAMSVSTATRSSDSASAVSGVDASELASTVGRLERQRGTDEEGGTSIGGEEETPPLLKQGTFGAKFSGTCNWLRVFLDPRKEVFEYAVFFEPDVDARNLRFKLMGALREQIGNVKSFDGAKLWLPDKLTNNRTLLTTPNPVTGETVTVRIDLKHRTEMSQCVQLYNVLFSRVMRQLQMTKVGLSYYLPGERFLVPQHKLEIWPGYVTAAHYMEGGVMLCVDTSHKLLRTTTAHEIISVAARARISDFEMSVKGSIVGSVVLTRYNNKTYIVDDVMFDQTPKSSFTNSKGETMTYIDYYKRQYNIVIMDENQPLFVHKLKKKEMKDMHGTSLVCLIPELCYMTGLTDQMRADFRVMKDVAQHTRLSPIARQECLVKFVRNVNGNPEASKILSDWGLSMDEAPIRLEGRVLPPEVLVFRNKEVPGSEIADFSRDAGRERVLVPVDLQGGQWVIIFTGKDDQTANQFVQMMQNVCRPLGVQFGAPQMVRLQQDRVDAYVSALREHYTKQLQLAVVIFPSQREDRYNAVKKVACGELGLPTQCIVARTIANQAKLRSITLKIALQINAKLGGELWALKIPMAGLMVCGIDVYHDPSQRGLSVAAFVASSNATLTRWFSRASFQHPGEEIVNGLKVAFMASLKHYYQIHQQLPKSIIVFRDGVSDHQMSMVRDYELPQLTSVFRNFDDYEPKISMVVVQKRINTRIYAALSGKGLDNPPPGSVIDHTITKRNWYDFLLVSQHVRQGTVSPTHYVVVQDGVGLKVDNMQRLTYKLTHLYYNWPGTIRVPAPCQYAHKLAYLVGQNIRKPPHDLLQDKLFYL